jgi:hypothetical protein
MKKIKEFFNWLDSDAGIFLIVTFYFSVITIIVLILFVIIAFAPSLFLVLSCFTLLFFLAHPIYLFYKKNKDT